MIAQVDQPDGTARLERAADAEKIARASEQAVKSDHWRAAADPGHGEPDRRAHAAACRAGCADMRSSLIM